ncbi:uncharacterized protein LOC129600062 [Paramacrobiotus metropolitanus]|uniref:uncharacterized protein LOC129600062 n=1 Tax=Paramacrobiotus metropolitanus TaxID=2943436 RepID=UPI00244584A0|nr:uncharacterized protein LOC129600062 [Paramacrobiotus metropolitanus]
MLIQILGLLSVLQRVLGSATDLEKDCSNATHDLHTRNATMPKGTFSLPFRTDLMTKEECITFATIGEGRICSLVSDIDSCNFTTQDFYYKYHALSRTYLEVECEQADRSDIMQLTRNISRISPNRAVTIELVEKSDPSGHVHFDVIEPIRWQIVGLTVISNTSMTTLKVYEAGTLPRLLRIEVEYGYNLVVKKKDVSRMPQIRMICFRLSNIKTLEQYTFMDLPHLESLMLEKEISRELDLKEWYAGRNRTYDSRFITSGGVHKVWRLHCGCSFAWLRNFLKQKPHKCLTYLCYKANTALRDQSFGSNGNSGRLFALSVGSDFRLVLLHNRPARLLDMSG